LSASVNSGLGAAWRLKRTQVQYLL